MYIFTVLNIGRFSLVYLQAVRRFPWTPRQSVVCVEIMYNFFFLLREGWGGGLLLIKLEKVNVPCGMNRNPSILLNIKQNEIYLTLKISFLTFKVKPTFFFLATCLALFTYFVMYVTFQRPEREREIKGNISLHWIYQIQPLYVGVLNILDSWFS